MRALRTAGLWSLIVFGVYGLVIVGYTLSAEIRWPSNIVSLVFTLLPLVVVTVAFLACIGIGVYFLFWRRRRKGVAQCLDDGGV